MRAPDASLPPAEPAERGVLPGVARPRAGLSGAAILIGAVLAGLLLFSILDARRRALSAPAVHPARSDLLGVSEAAPALYIPVRAAETNIPSDAPRADKPVTRAPTHSLPPPHSFPSPPPGWQPYSSPVPPSPAPGAFARGSILVFDAPSSPAPEAAGNSGRGHTLPGDTVTRSRAGVMSSQQTTIPQGTLIPAVLETAFNSTGSGFTRALVQRDVYGFDGSRVLVPRGSRLIGVYASDTSPGQKRAFVTWTRLIRPDGVTIALGSPTADPVGVGGVRAKVDSHFFERFADSLLQSAMLIGGNLAARSVGDSVVVALPGSFPGGSATMPATQIPPTLSVRQGTSISVFVARDLDFTGVEAPR